MFTLIKNANLYAPAYLGKTDILLCGEKIAHISKTIELNESFCHTIDVQGKIVTPGFIDQHVHITGGGGQQGYASLVPEVTMSELVACGTTTVLGMLGTDGFAKELTTLYAKAKAIDDDGLSAYMLTSYYGLPTKTLMNSVADDLIFIDKVIGCKLAMSDDRSPFPTEQEILRILIEPLGPRIELAGHDEHIGIVLFLHNPDVNFDQIRADALAPVLLFHTQQIQIGQAGQAVPGHIHDAHGLGDGAGGGVKDRVQEPLQFLWQPQKAGALALGHHRAGGAPAFVTW